MSNLGLPIFDQSIHAANVWLNTVMEHTGPDRQRAYHALRAVLHTLRDRLTIEEATDLGAQLPTFVRGVYYEGWNPAKTPMRLRSRDAFLEKVQERLSGIGPMNPEQATNAVFATQKQRCDAGELDNVGDQLPEDLRQILKADP